MRGCVNAGLASEFDAFRRGLAADYLAWQAELVKEYKRPEQFITHNMDFEWKKFGADIAQDGYSYGVQPDADHARVSDALTVAGCDIYHPSQDRLTGAETSFCGDEIRALKGRPYLVLETQAQAFKYWTPYPGQLRLQAYAHLAQGACGMLYWNWHSIHNGYETYWKGLLSHDLKENPAYEEARGIGREWREHGEELILTEKKNKTALVVDNRTLTAFKWFPIDRELSYNDVVRWVYDCLYELNIECDVVFADRLRPEDYRVIIAPALYSAGEELINRLKSFVEEGGVLIATFKSFVADRNLSVYPDTQPHILHECFGMHYNQFTEPGTTQAGGRPVRYWQELLNTDGAEVLCRYTHKYWGRYAAATANSFGKGRAYYIGCYADREVLKDLLVRAYRESGAEPVPEARWPVVVKSGRNAAGGTLHYVLHYSGQEGAFLCPYDRVLDLTENSIYAKGDCIALRDWDVHILKEI